VLRPRMQRGRCKRDREGTTAAKLGQRLSHTAEVQCGGRLRSTVGLL